MTAESTGKGRRQPVSKPVKPEQRKTSELLGVSWDQRRNKWKARLHWQRKEYFLGRFDDADAAGHAYDVALDVLARCSQQQASASAAAYSRRTCLSKHPRNFEGQRFHDPGLEAKVQSIFAEQCAAHTGVAYADAETEAVQPAAGQSTPCTSAANDDTAMQLGVTTAAAPEAAAATTIELEVGDRDPVPAGAALAADSALSSNSSDTQQQQQQQPRKQQAQQSLPPHLLLQHTSDGTCLQRNALSTPSSRHPVPTSSSQHGQDQQRLQQQQQQQPEGMHWEPHPAPNQCLAAATRQQQQQQPEGMHWEPHPAPNQCLVAATRQQQQQQQVPTGSGLSDPLPDLHELLGGLQQPAACDPQNQQECDLGFGTLLRMGSSAAAALLEQALEELAAAEGATATAAAAPAVDGDCIYQQQLQQQQLVGQVQHRQAPQHSLQVLSGAHNNNSTSQGCQILQPALAGPATAGSTCDATPHLMLPGGEHATAAAAAAASAGQQLLIQSPCQQQQQQVCVEAPAATAAAAAPVPQLRQGEDCLPVEDLSGSLLGLVLSPADVEVLMASYAAADVPSPGTQHSTAQHMVPPAPWAQPTWQSGCAANHHQQVHLHRPSPLQQQQQQQVQHDVYSSYSIDSTQHVAAAGPASSRVVDRTWAPTAVVPAGGVAADAPLLSCQGRWAVPDVRQMPAQAQPSMQLQEPHLSQQQQQQQQSAQGGYQMHRPYTQPEQAAAAGACRSATLLLPPSLGQSTLSDTLLQPQSSCSLLPDIVLTPLPPGQQQPHSMRLLQEQPQQEVSQGRQQAFSPYAGVGGGVSPYAAAAAAGGGGGGGGGGAAAAAAGGGVGCYAGRVGPSPAGPGLLSTFSRAKALSFTAACMQAVFDLRRQLLLQQQQQVSLACVGVSSSSRRGGGVSGDSSLAGWLVRLRLNLQTAVREGSTDGDVTAAIAVLVGRLAQRLAGAETAAAAAGAGAAAAASILPVGEELALEVCVRLQCALWGLAQLLLGLPRDGIMPLRGVVQGWVQALREGVGGAGVGAGGMAADAVVLQLAELL